MKKLSDAQRAILRMIGDGPNLHNGDEGSPTWWIDGGPAVNPHAAMALVRGGLVHLAAHWGGQPGVDGYSISPAGRLALEEAPAEPEPAAPPEQRP